MGRCDGKRAAPRMAVTAESASRDAPARVAVPPCEGNGRHIDVPTCRPIAPRSRSDEDNSVDVRAIPFFREGGRADEGDGLGKCRTGWSPPGRRDCSVTMARTAVGGIALWRVVLLTLRAESSSRSCRSRHWLSTDGSGSRVPPGSYGGGVFRSSFRGGDQWLLTPTPTFVTLALNQKVPVVLSRNLKRT